MIDLSPLLSITRSTDTVEDLAAAISEMLAHLYLYAGTGLAKHSRIPAGEELLSRWLDAVGYVDDVAKRRAARWCARYSAIGHPHSRPTDDRTEGSAVPLSVDDGCETVNPRGRRTSIPTWPSGTRVPRQFRVASPREQAQSVKRSLAPLHRGAFSAMRAPTRRSCGAR